MNEICLKTMAKIYFKVGRSLLMLLLIEKLTKTVQCCLLRPGNTTYVIDYEKQVVYWIYGWKG